MTKIPDSHQGFQLSKRDQDDETVGIANVRHIICKFCKKILIPEGCAMKIFKDVR